MRNEKYRANGAYKRAPIPYGIIYAGIMHETKKSGKRRFAAIEGTAAAIAATLNDIAIQFKHKRP